MMVMRVPTMVESGVGSENSNPAHVIEAVEDTTTMLYVISSAKVIAVGELAQVMGFTLLSTSAEWGIFTWPPPEEHCNPEPLHIVEAPSVR